jgi:hypothetical protein
MYFPLKKKKRLYVHVKIKGYKYVHTGQAQWLTSIIPTAQEAEIERITV